MNGDENSNDDGDDAGDDDVDEDDEKALTELKYQMISLCAFLYINLYNYYIHCKAIQPLWVGFDIHYADAIHVIGDFLMQ